MLKGCQREMIVLQTQESELFESAYFILRRRKKVPTQSDMVAEANRIVSFGGSCFGGRKSAGKGRFWLFLGGFLLGAVLGVLLGALILA